MNTNIDHIIARAFLGVADEMERKALESWLDASPQNQYIFHALQEEWHTNRNIKKSIGEDEIVDKIWNKAHVGAKAKRRSRSSIFPFMMKVAAAIAFVLGAYFLYNQKTKEASPNVVQVAELIIKENISGQKSKLQLSDGTVVWLNAESSLIYKKPFDNSLREVELDGEAYFEVAKDAERPFVVSFDGTKVKVLGTSFNISSYDNEPSKVISLVEGSIEIVNGEASELLSPGWIAEIDNNTHSLKSYEGSVDDNTCWTDDILLFKQASYQEVFSKLEKWYGVKMIVSGTPKSDLAFNGAFESEYLENVLENLILDNNLTYNIDKEQVFINFK